MESYQQQMKIEDYVLSVEKNPKKLYEVLLAISALAQLKGSRLSDNPETIEQKRVDRFILLISEYKLTYNHIEPYYIRGD